MRSALQHILLVIALLSSYSGLHAQDTLLPGFTRTFDVPVVGEQGPYRNAWLGGLNSCHFDRIDMNLDGIQDLFVFDKSGFRILTFINQGTPDSIDYTYAPEYAARFPLLHDWVIFRDYDYDGKKDIFTYSVGGMSVFRNVSDTVLKFKMMTFMLNSFYYNNYINIWVTNVDYPGIMDLDHDGDLDILSFWGIGSLIEYHKNLSMEKYGVPDSLDFMMVHRCWGYIFESEVSNLLSLNFPCPYIVKDGMDPLPDPAARNIEHVGSTFLLLDINADSLPDLLLGDVDYPNPVMLINGGTLDSAHIVSQDTLFPNNTTPIRLVSFPVVNYLDIDNDGINELLASPFDPSPIIPENLRSVWYYENNGTNSLPQFEFIKDNFLQDEMIEVGAGAYPVFFDYNGDGLKDLVVSNYGVRDSSYYQFGFLYSIFSARLALFKNIGSADHPAFELIDRDWMNISQAGLISVYPAFADLDGDGDSDMLLGRADGTVDMYENIAPTGSPASFIFVQNNYQSIDAGKYATPQFFDLNNDQLPDLVLGNENGTLFYYENQGTASSPAFQYITDSLGKVDVRDDWTSYTGYSVPCFYRGSNDSVVLMVGGLRGFVAYYRNISGHLADTFELVDQQFLLIDEGEKSAPAITDLNNDGYPDMVIGNYAGGLTYYKGEKDIGAGLQDQQAMIPLRMIVFPNPASGVVFVEFEGIRPSVSIRYQLTEMSGRVVKEGVINDNTVNVSGLSTGIYFLRVSVTGNDAVNYTLVRKVVIR